MSFSDHNVFNLASTGRTSSAAPNRSNFRPTDLRALYESRAVDRTSAQMSKCLAPSFSEHLQRFEETLEANLVIFVGQ